MIQIIPAILAKTEEQFQKDLQKLESAEVLEGSWVHIDFADNKFVQNQTIEPAIIEKYSTNFRKEAHLMVSHPKDWIEKLVNAGFERIIFHIESEDDILEVINQIKSKGMEIGLAINKDTSIEKLIPFVDKIDVILVMTIVAGFQGQPFIPELLEKVKEVKSKGWTPLVGVDGAVKDSNIKRIAQSGVDFVEIGSYLLKGDIEENLEILWEALG